MSEQWNSMGNKQRWTELNISHLIFFFQIAILKAGMIFSYNKFGKMSAYPIYCLAFSQ